MPFDFDDDRDDQPLQPYTDGHRQLFQMAEKLNREHQDLFVEADKWIDTPPQTPMEKLEEYRKQCKWEREYRRGDGDRASMIVDGKWHHELLKLRRLEQKYNLLDATAFMDEHVNYGPHGKGAFFPLECSDTLLARERRRRAQNIRYGIESIQEAIKEYVPPRPDELLSWACGKLMGSSAPDFDRMDLADVQLWAPRVLRVLWAITDRGNLTGAHIAWLEKMPWIGLKPGENKEEFMARTHLVDGIGRGWVSVKALATKPDRWEKLATDAIREWKRADSTVVQLLEPGPKRPGETQQQKPKPSSKKVDDPDETESPPKADPVSVAIAMKAKDPALTVRKAAAAVGMPFSTLQKDPTWQIAVQRVKQQARGNIRRGSKSTDGRIEAMADDAEE